MSTSNDATSRNVLEKQYQARKEENTHEHKDAYENAQKDKHKKRHEKKKNSHAAATAPQAPTVITDINSFAGSSSSSNSISNLSNIALATQFSIQRTDSDGCLRMKISAIRPTTTITVAPAPTVITENIVINPTAVQKTTSSKSKTFKEERTLDKNKTSETLKFKISPSTRDKTRNNTDSKATNMTSVIVNPLSKNRNDISQLSLSVSGTTTTTVASTTMTCLSEATDSGCSEATNTTTATVGQEKISKRKIKRKKALIKTNDTKRVLKTLKPLEIAIENVFSTDSEDEPLAQKLMVSNVEGGTQRAPRILLTAINSKNVSAPPHFHASINNLQHGSDHIGLSSSDNELPNIRAAIERVVGETDEDDNLSSSHFHKSKTKHLPQYQSTLLQDFMEKTQMLGQTPKSSDNVKPKSIFQQNEILLQLNTNSQSDSIASSSASNNKKRRGRPKKPDKNISSTLNLMSPVHVNNKNLNINESADSGVISTTSVSTQSTSPHPCTTLASSSINDNTSSTNSPNKNISTTPEKQTHETSSSSSTTKPKIDIALLDKRMYATERVLYPPPRNKRRQSTSAALASACEKTKAMSSKTQQQPSSKDDLQLDPVWRKIDINRKFRRPSVCSTTGYKSDGGVDDRVRDRTSKSTICSKVLAAKSGYVSDYGTSSFRLSRHSKHASHNSGYKSDASCKSRYSTKSSASRKSRAKSCGYRSDCKESVVGSSKSSKFRRKRRASIMQKSMGSLKDEQDILQLAGLSLGQSSEESNEYVCKPSLEKLPTTSASKKYGEINRYIATGEYFGRGSSSQHNSHNSFASISNNSVRIFDVPTDMPQTPSKITLLQRKNSTTSEFAHDLLQLHGNNPAARKIKSRRSSVASFCSSYYSAGTTKLKKRRRRKSFRYHNSSACKNSAIDSKLLTEIEILTNTFSTRCRIQPCSIIDKLAGGSLSQKEKLMAEATKLQQSLAAAAAVASTSASSSSKRDSREKRSVKKRKISENLDFAMLSARAESNSLTPGSSSGQGTSSKRRHKKASSSSPDDHKLPLKKRHYLLTPGEKSSEVSVAVAAKLFANNAEAWAAAAAAAKSTANTKSQLQFNARTAKANLTPKKRHLLQQTPHTLNEDSNSNKTASTLSPLRVAVGDPNSISGGKLLDISPQSLSNLKQVTEAVNKKRSRLEGLVSKIATTHGEDMLISSRPKPNISTALQIESESSSCPPPGVFEPSVELEIQIPPITKLSDAASTIIAKSEIESPLLIDLNKGFVDNAVKNNGPRVVESLLNKTGGNLILKRKRKKINRTGFPTIKRKKRKLNENLLDVTAEENEHAEHTSRIIAKDSLTKSPDKQCDRVPKQGETSQTFLERINRTPRLSVVALERLQESPLSNKDKTPPIEFQYSADALTTPKTRHTRHITKRRVVNEQKESGLKESKSITELNKSEQLQQHEQDDDDKPLAVRARRSKAVLDVKGAVIKPSPTKKSVVSKTAKSLLESNIKLPAGVDPKSILSCKIKLKRRNSIHTIASKKSSTALGPPSKPVIKEIPRSAEEIEIDSKSKDCNINYMEHDVLPISETNLITPNGDTTEASDTSDEKSSTNSAVIKKVKLNKKSYLTAGLFSDYFKVTQTAAKKNSNKKDSDKKTEAESVNVTKDLETVKLPLLPPPPYCETYLRRTEYDFELPYDIWWAYKNAKLPNRITVPSWNFRKIRTNIYAENVKPSPIAANDHPMCICKAEVGCAENCLNRMVYTECSPSNCPTREKCRNQKIQKHDIAPGVERFMTENKGWGVRTKMPIEKGTYILEYVGEVVTEREFKDRMATIYLNDTHHYCLHLDGGLVIDGQRMGSDCRFVNHSCEPNCEMQKWSVNGLSRMALFAKRNIAEGEELTYDYNFSLFNPSEGQPCRCNTPNCRGVIGGKSQRVKPLPVEAKPTTDTTPKEGNKSRQRKRKARKNTQRPTTKDITTPTRMQPLTEKERKLVKQYSVFLIRNFERIRAKKFKRKGGVKTPVERKVPTPTNTSKTLTISSSIGSPAVITQRRPSTPSSLAAQISALCTARNIKTRGLTLAVQDPEVEKMAKMAKILRDICTNLESRKNPEHNEQTLVSVLQSLKLSVPSTNKKKKTFLKVQQHPYVTDLKTIQNNIEQGYYKLPDEFNTDMYKLFEEAKSSFDKEDQVKMKLVELLEEAFVEEKCKQYSALLEILGNESLLKDFDKDNCKKLLEISNQKKAPLETTSISISPIPLKNTIISPVEDIIRCICGLFRDEGLMIQCARCMVWQHTECTKADVNADNYHCEQCEPREVDREIPLDDYTEEGYRYYLTLMRGNSLQVRQGDAVYVLRDIPIKDSTGNIVPSKKHTYETIGDVDYNECDIFRVERLWKDDIGKRFIFGHHFLRPHETFHEPSRKFYPNEVVRVPLYEVVPIDLVMGRCWVLDRTTFCKGRPIECNDENHCFICELRVDKSARFFSKAKTNHPICTKSYAFRKFNEKLKICKTYAPHDVDPSMLKPKKQKAENDNQSSNSIATAALFGSPVSCGLHVPRQELNKTPQNQTKKRQGSKSPANVAPPLTQSQDNYQPPLVTVKEKRKRLESVLKIIKSISIPKSTQNHEPPLDLTYLLTGRGARQRKILTF